MFVTADVTLFIVRLSSQVVL